MRCEQKFSVNKIATVKKRVDIQIVDLNHLIVIAVLIPVLQFSIKHKVIL